MTDIFYKFIRNAIVAKARFVFNFTMNFAMHSSLLTRLKEKLDVGLLC